MPNIHISELGKFVLRNRKLAEAISNAILDGPYTADGNSAIATYNGKEIIVNLWPSETEIAYNEEKRRK